MRYLRQKGNGSLPLSRTILDGYAAEIALLRAQD